MRGFDEVVIYLCKTKKCCVLSHKGNVIKVQSQSATFYDDLAYFKAVCDCYTAAVHGSTAWVISVNIEEYTVEFGYNY